MNKLTVVLALLVVSTACKPPIDENEAPSLVFTFPDDGAIVNQTDDAALLITVTDRDADPLELVLTDDVNGNLGTFEAATTEVVSIPIADLTSGPHTVTATVSDGTASASAVRTFTLNAAPSDPVLAISPEDPDTTDNLVVSIAADAVDPEGLAVVYDLSWASDDGKTAAGDTVPAALTSKGQVWTATVVTSESDDGTTVKEGGISTTTTASVEIVNAPPTSATAVEVTPADPLLINDLHCVATGATDIDGDELSYSYQWNVNGTPAPDLTDEYLPSAELSAGEQWTCSAATTDGEATAASVAASNTVTAGDLERPANEARVRITGDRNDQHVGTCSFGLDMDQVPGDDLLLAVPGFEEGVATEPSGLVAIYAGPGLSTSLLTGRDYSLIGGNPGFPIAEAAARVPNVLGSATDDLVVQRIGATRSSVHVIPSQTLNSSASAPYSGVVLQGATVEFGALLAGGDIDGDDIGEVFASDGDGVWMFDGAGIAAANPSNGACDVTTACLATTQAQAELDVGAAVLAIAVGDFDGDFAQDIAVFTDTTGTIGYLFSGETLAPGGVFGTDAAIAITADFTADDLDLGLRAAMIPDLDGDDTDELIVGVPGADAVGADGGWVGVIYGRSGDASFALEDADSEISASAAGGELGDNLAILGDIGVDGLSELGVSAPGLNDSAGKVYLFAGDTLAGGQTLSTAQARSVLVGEEAGARLGVCGPAGDYDGDGSLDVAVGAPFQGSNDLGRAYVFLTGE